MDKQEIKDYIHDHVRHSTDSSNQAIIEMIRSMQIEERAYRVTLEKRAEEHKQEELASREVYREQLLNAVEKKLETKIEAKVNGKIDRLSLTVEEIKQNIENLKKEIKEIQPLKERFEEADGFWKTIKRYAVGIGLFSGIMVSIGVIVSFISRFK